MIRKDVLLFIIVFAEALFAFSGSFFFALNSELVEVNITNPESLNNNNGTNGSSSEQANDTTILVPESELNPLETGYVNSIMFHLLKIGTLTPGTKFMLMHIIILVKNNSCKTLKLSSTVNSECYGNTRDIIALPSIFTVFESCIQVIL